LATGILLAVAFGFRVAGAKADTTLGSYSVIASAPGLEFTEDEPSAQAHPEGQGDVPYTTSLLAGGGLGYALSTIAWPGAYGGNAGSLVLVALPSQVGPVPRPDAVTNAVTTVSPALQYPIRAEARSGSAPDASYGQIPGTTLSSHADANDVHAVADVQGATQPGAATYGNLHSDSSSTLNGNSVKALADSVLHDVDIAGGAIKIKSLTSTATATTDGSTSSSNGGTVVSGMTVGGQPAYLDQDGLHIGSSNQPANAAISAAANQVLTNFGMKVFVSQPQTERTDGGITYQASSVVFTWVPPSNPSNNVFLLTLGGARVQVAAGAGFDTAGTTADTGAAAPSTDTGSGDTSALGTTAVSGDTGGLTGATAGVGTTNGSGGGSVGQSAQALGGQTIAKTFGGVGTGWLLLGLAAAALLGYGSYRLLADLVDRPPATCPLEVPR
jgi:hypothetical protein